MLFITFSPASLRYTWEAEVLWHNVTKRNKYPADKCIWITYSTGDDAQGKWSAEAVASRYGVSHHHYTDDRPLKDYPTSIRLWLWKKFLEEDPRRQQQKYFYIDTDVVFYRLPSFNRIHTTPTHWVGSNTTHYAGIPVIREQLGESALDIILEETGSLFSDLMVNLPYNPGAQWVIDSPTPEVFERAYYASEGIYTRLEGIEPVEGSFLTRWVADMWALPWTLHHSGIRASITRELEFSMSKDPFPHFFLKGIYHNAGVNRENAVSMRLFDKERYWDEVPFGKQLVVNEKACSYHYAQCIKEVDPSTEVLPASRVVFVDEQGNHIYPPQL